MKAAVVRSFDRRPRYESFAAPAPSADNDVVVEVLAAGLHPRVRSAASGQHYTTSGALPMVPGVDGVGRLPDGTSTPWPSTARTPWCPSRARPPR